MLVGQAAQLMVDALSAMEAAAKDREGIPACSQPAAWRDVTWRLHLLSRLNIPPSLRCWAFFFLACLHDSRSRALLSAFKAGLTQDPGLNDAKTALALLQTAAQQAAAAGMS
jgi:hypothetical protein